MNEKTSARRGAPLYIYLDTEEDKSLDSDVRAQMEREKFRGRGARGRFVRMALRAYINEKTRKRT